MSNYKGKESLQIDDYVDLDDADNVRIKSKDSFESFETLKDKLDIKKIVSEFAIKKENFVFNKESNLEDDYKLDGELGQGTYGVVYKGIHKLTGEIRAIKQIPRSKITKYERFVNEVTALKTLDHPNIIKLFEIYEDETQVYLVQEMCTGGELFDRIVEKEYLSEKQASILFQQILQSILHCNKNRISHRDLKPENFMFKSRDEDSNLKLIDFGLSMSYFKIDKDQQKSSIVRMKTRAGTAFFMAPEVISHDFTESCDMWSAGAMLYIMLWGYPPFYGENDQEILEAVLAGTYDFDDEVWDEVSAEAKDLINKLLVPEKDRLTPKEALHHPWIKHKEKNWAVPNKHLDRLKDFQKAKKLKKAALTYLASRTSDDDVSEEMQIFLKLDKNKDGYITLKELKEGMKDLENIDELAEILKGVDVDNNGAINYTEFIAATLDQNTMINQSNKIKDAFEIFDIDGDGVIDENEMKAAFNLEDGDGKLSIENSS
jgi:calcium-dependent protein kinase